MRHSSKSRPPTGSAPTSPADQTEATKFQQPQPTGNEATILPKRRWPVPLQAAAPSLDPEGDLGELAANAERLGHSFSAVHVLPPTIPWPSDSPNISKEQHDSSFPLRSLPTPLHLPPAVQRQVVVQRYLDDLDWGNVVAVPYFKDDQNKVAQIQFKDDSSVFVKLQSAIASAKEVYLSKIAEAMGFQVAKSRLVTTVSVEGRKVLDVVNRFKGANLKDTDFSSIMLLETLKGSDTPVLGAGQANELGRVAAFNIFTLGKDRLPVFGGDAINNMRWSTEGRFQAIDNDTTYGSDYSSDEVRLAQIKGVLKGNALEVAKRIAGAIKAVQVDETKLHAGILAGLNTISNFDFDFKGERKRLRDELLELGFEESLLWILDEGGYASFLADLAPKIEGMLASAAPAQERRGRRCFITSACVEAMGLEDDCEDLRVLRDFRDQYMASFSEGRGLVEEYYNVAPRILRGIYETEEEEEGEEILRALYCRIRSAVIQVKAKENEAALRSYVEMVLDLKRQYCQPEA